MLLGWHSWNKWVSRRQLIIFPPKFWIYVHSILHDSILIFIFLALWLLKQKYIKISIIKEEVSGSGYKSVQFSCSVLSDSLQPHESQHARPPCPLPNPRVHPNPCPLSRWCHPAISSSVVSFSSCPQSFPASGSFQISQLFTSGGQSTGVSASTSVLPMNTQTDLL